MIPILKTVSDQTADVYKLLSQGRALTIQEVADQLRVLPNGLYRISKKLEALGAIEALPGYPQRYQATSGQTALNLYLTAASHNFRQSLGIAPEGKSTVETPTISIIKDRETLLRRSAADVRAAKHTIEDIVSGFMIPDDNFLAYRQAIAKGVKVRSIVQEKAEIGGQRLENWKELGVDVRYLPELQIRMLIYDRKIVYLSTQDPSNQAKGFGIRFDYAPLAKQMGELFELNWQKAAEL